MDDLNRINTPMKTFREFIKENETDDIESYRQEALRRLHNNMPAYKKHAEETLGVKLHRAEPSGSVTDPKRFNADSDVDMAFHYDDPQKPRGPDEEKTEQLRGHFFDGHCGHIDCIVHNTPRNKK